MRRLEKQIAEDQGELLRKRKLLRQRRKLLDETIEDTTLPLFDGAGNPTAEAQA